MRQVSPVLDDVTALAFTSVNGVEAFATLTTRRDLPVFAVGDVTAAAAGRAGFVDVRSADGDLSDLATLIAASAPAGGWLLAPGAQQPSGDLPALLAGRVRVRTLPVYEAIDTGAAAPPGWDAVMIHSRRAALALAARIDASLAGRVVVAISEAAAAPLLGSAIATVRIASRPREADMLEALGKPAPRV